jgi:hypothetical protein
MRLKAFYAFCGVWTFPGSGVGVEGEQFEAGMKAEGRKGAALLFDLAAQDGNQVETRESGDATASLWQGCKLRRALGAVSEQAGEQKRTISGDDKGGLASHRGLGPQLRLSDFHSILLFPVIFTCRVRDWRGARLPGSFRAPPHKNCS